MSRTAWDRSGRRPVGPASGRAGVPAGVVWSAALARARGEWERLAADGLSEAAAVAVLGLAVALRPMVARELGDGEAPAE